MPSHEGRGRPRVAHEGACGRQHKNRRTLDNRIAAFERAVLADASDRSTLPHAGRSSSVRRDHLDDAVMPTAAHLGDFEDLGSAGYREVDLTPNVRALPPAVLLALMHEWEEHRARWNGCWSDEERFAQEDRERAHAEALAGFRALPEAEQASRLAARVEERRARADDAG